MKYLLRITLLLLVCFILVGCGISKSDLNDNKEQYRNSIKKLCDEYNLTDVKIEIDDFSKIDNIYIASAYIYSDDFSNLESNQAYLFAKELSEMSDINDTIIYSDYIVSKNSKYHYETEKNIQYLIKDNESVYTIKNGQVMYDIFEKGY